MSITALNPISRSDRRDPALAGAPSTDQHEQRLLAHVIAPCLTPAARLVEIGSGTGKWTLRLAPLVREVVAVDVDPAAIEAARAHVLAAGMRNVTFLVGSGRDLAAVETEQTDVVFSYDTFAELTRDDAAGYVAEIARVLRDGGLAVVHHAIADVPPAWDETAPVAPDPARRQSRTEIDQMYARLGLRIESSWTASGTTVVVVRKPADSVVPRFEYALRWAARAEGEAELALAVRAISEIGREMQARLDPLTAALAAAAPGPARQDLVRQIRRLVRG